MPTFHLVVDEFVPVASHRFRVRVWRRADSRPLVLLSHVNGGVPPDWCSSQLANFALRSFLGYSAVIPTIYELSRFDGKSIYIQARFDRVALHENRLAFISLVAFSQDVKAIRAAFAAALSSPMRLKHVELTKDDECVVPSDVWPSLSGYPIDAHRLGFGSIHALFICRQQGFLPNDSDGALWAELKQERFTTPLLRSWLPYIRKELEIKSLLSRCHTLDCTCCILTATSADLDSIVEFGLKNNLISIREEAV